MIEGVTGPMSHRGAVPPHTSRRTLPCRGPKDLVRNGRRDAGRPRRISAGLQHETPPSGPRHEGAYTHHSLRRGSAQTRKKGHACSRIIDEATQGENEPGKQRSNPGHLIRSRSGDCQVITVLVHTDCLGRRKRLLIGTPQAIPLLALSTET